METLIVKARTKKIANQVVNRLQRLKGVSIRPSGSWKEIDAMLPNISISEADIMKEVRAVRHGAKK